MGAKESAAMKEASRLIMKKNLTVRQAAKLAEISHSAIYMSKWYKEWKSKKSKKQKII